MGFSDKGERVAIQVTGATGAIVANFGFASSTRTGAGAYTLVSNRAFTNPVVTFCILGGAGNANYQVAPNADKVTFAVTTFVGAAATDENFVMALEEMIV